MKVPRGGRQTGMEAIALISSERLDRFTNFLEVTGLADGQMPLGRRIPVLLVLLGALLAAPLPGLAQEEITSAVVRGDNVVLRSEPAPDADVVGTLQRGDAIRITGDAETEK